MVREAGPTGVSASLEDYLEAIYWLQTDHAVARAKEIALRLEVTKSSVTTALRQLNADGLVNYDPYNYITLTPSGRGIAERVIRRHTALYHFLHRVLGVDAAQADASACMLEHAVADEVLERLEAFMAFADERKPDFSAWLRARAAENAEEHQLPLNPPFSEGETGSGKD